METTRNSVKVKLVIKFIKLVSDLLGVIVTGWVIVFWHPHIHPKKIPELRFQAFHEMSVWVAYQKVAWPSE